MCLFIHLRGSKIAGAANGYVYEREAAELATHDRKTHRSWEKTLGDRRTEDAVLKAGVQRVTWRQSQVRLGAHNARLGNHLAGQDDGCVATGTDVKGSGTAVLVGWRGLLVAGLTRMRRIAMQDQMYGILRELCHSWCHHVGN